MMNTLHIINMLNLYILLNKIEHVNPNGLW